MLTFSTLILLAIVAFFAGLLNAIAGAGGLLTLPMLLAVGLSPLTALGTSKFQSFFGTATSGWNYYRHGYIATPKVALISAVIGAILGSLAVQQISPAYLNIVVPVMLITTALYYAFSPRISDQNHAPALSEFQFNAVVTPCLAFLSGFFGPGSGLFFAAALSYCLGYNILKATASAKPLVLCCMGISFLIFVLAGQINWSAALVMALAQGLGGKLGSTLAIRRGSKLIRPLVIIAAVSLAGKALFDTL